jgi:pimeloyl-ACP methyl ester carboxylesterase
MGGFQIRYFAHLYPDEVAGLVFIDAPHEDWFSYIRSRHTSEELTYFNNFFDPSKRNLKGGDSAELSFYTAMCDSIKGKNIPSQIPVRMYTGTAVSDWAQQFGYDEKDMHVWAAMQKSILDGVVDAQQCADNDAAHYFHMDKPLVVLDGIRYLIKKSRSSVRPTPVNSKNQ